MKLTAETHGRDVLLAIADGDQQAFSSLFDTYKQKVYSYSSHFTHSSFIAEEITQEVFLKIWKNRASLSEIENIEAWIGTITRNLCLNHLKKIARERKHVRQFTARHTEEERQVEQYIAYKDQLALLAQALDQLSPQQKLIYRLNRDEGLKNDEIARRLNLSTNTVKTHMVSALRKIRHFISSNPAMILPLIWFLSKKIF